MLFLPECFSFLGRSPAESLAAAQPLAGPLMQCYRQLAADSGLWLSLGGFQEAGPNRERLYNCHVIIDDRGEIKATYRKIHLFDVSAYMTRGDALPHALLSSQQLSTRECIERSIVSTYCIYIQFVLTQCDERTIN
jgi:predicted amidohydrolase